MAREDSPSGSSRGRGTAGTASVVLRACSPRRRSRGLAASLLVLLALVTGRLRRVADVIRPRAQPGRHRRRGRARPRRCSRSRAAAASASTARAARRSSVDRDGTVRSAAKPPNVLGTIPPAQLAALDAAIKLTDFALLKSRPFTGECPTDFDGQEFIFEFAAPGGTERIATCEVDVDYGLPLFVAVSTALGPFVPLPTT